MRRKDLVTTTMALTLAVFMSAVSTGCGGETEETIKPEVMNAVVSTEVSTEVLEEKYEKVKVDKEYTAMLIEDAGLVDYPDSKEFIVDLAKDAYVTVTHEVLYNGVSVDYYYVETEDGSKGFIEGRYLEFNVDVLEDYADSLVEVEGGDGEEESTEVIDAEVESTESTEVTEETPQEEEEVGFGFNVTDCEPHTKYTNTNCNIRSIPDKSGELVNTAVINTELTVTGTTDNGWSRVETLGMVAYIKSSLLSDTKTKVQTQQTAPSQSQSSQPSGGTQPQSQTQQTPSQPTQPQQTQPAPQPQAPAQNEPDLGALFGDTSQGGAGGSIGTTGTNSNGLGLGGGY